MSLGEDRFRGWGRWSRDARDPAARPAGFERTSFDAAAWSDIKTVTLGPQLDREHAYEMLERRARGL